MQLLIIVLIAVLLFGAKKLPQLARSLGESMNEFRKAREEGEMDAKLAEAKRREAERKPDPAKSDQA
jgi:sec-independent protein translocase protein TatA